ncbi:hypothetical protein R80B4_00334 [Fibrobacteres bacterium R8-0-B4]
MEALVIDIKALPETVFSFIGTERVRVSREEAGKLVLTSAADGDIDAERAERRAKRRAAFDKCRIDLTGFKFDRDAANDYE